MDNQSIAAIFSWQRKHGIAQCYNWHLKHRFLQKQENVHKTWRVFIAQIRRNKKRPSRRTDPASWSPAEAAPGKNQLSAPPFISSQNVTSSLSTCDNRVVRCMFHWTVRYWWDARISAHPAAGWKQKMSTNRAGRRGQRFSARRKNSLATSSKNRWPSRDVTTSWSRCCVVVAVVHAADADAAAVGFPLDVSIEKLAVLEESAGRQDWHLATPAGSK